ncbi:hypothetical protein [Paraburkholderia sp. EG304]|uniref:hypothetical protein n=1 Tax=Paraburkholderia sp. EG304 TaxID=3237015 RepID=UPI00397E57CA
MTGRLLKEAATASIILASLSGVVQAQNHACTTASLRGAYGVKVHGEALGILTGTAPSQMLHRYATPTVIDGVALAKFDGAGAGTQIDYAMLNGTVRPGSPPDSFQDNETLTYTVNADCTGDLRLDFHNGSTLTQKMVVVDNGNEIFGVTSAQHIASGAPALDGTKCDMGCEVAIQVSTHFVKVSQANQR